jgi:hypothetical protein
MEDNIKKIKNKLATTKQLMKTTFNTIPHFLLRNYSTKFDIEHLKNCNCCDDIIFSIIDDEIDKELENRKNKNYPINDNSIAELMKQKEKKSKIKDEIYHKALIYINTNLKDMQSRICPYVYKELLDTINLFEKDYDLKKAKIQVTIKSILNYQVSLINSIIYSNSKGFIEKTRDKQGNQIDKINANEYYKIRLNEKIIQAVKTLDDMVEGSKSINLNINTSSISFKDVLGKLQEEIKEDYDSCKK